MTHQDENRFGGGNESENVGLKPDGEALLDYLHDRQIAIDFSHTSDALAEGILGYITKNSLNMPVLASHSNFRAVYGHARNLPYEIAKEILHRGGLIALNLIKFLLNPEDPNALVDHLNHGLNLGAETQLGFGADYFHTKGMRPVYFEEHAHAGKFPAILEMLSSEFGHELLKAICYRNCQQFIEDVWGES